MSSHDTISNAIDPLSTSSPDPITESLSHSSKSSFLSKSFSLRKKTSTFTLKRTKTESSASLSSLHQENALEHPSHSKDNDNEPEPWNLAKFKPSSFPVDERFCSFRWCSIKDWSSKNLSILILCNNDFELIPTEVYQLKNLVFLSLSSNHISSLSPELTSLSKLEILNLSSNKLTLQEVENVNWRKMDSLKALVLIQNKIEAFPISLVNTKIEFLALSKNRIKEIPKEIICMHRLDWLGLSDNLIENIEPVLRLKKLKGLTIANNPIKDMDMKLEQRLSSSCELTLLFNDENPPEAVPPPNHLIYPVEFYDALAEMNNIKSIDTKSSHSSSLGV